MSFDHGAGGSPGSSFLIGRTGGAYEDFEQTGGLLGEQMAITQLPDPRRWHKPESKNLLLRLTLESAAGDQDAHAELLNALRACMAQDNDDQIAETLRSSPSHAVYRHFWETVCAAADFLTLDDEAVMARPFAIPIVLVAHAKRQVIIPGTIPDIGAVTALLEAHRAVGPTRNFGLSNAMSSQELMDRLKPSEISRWANRFSDGTGLREVEPREIIVEPGRERVHLRFLIGAGITSSSAPSFVETAANIGTWGMALTRELTRQLAQPGLDVLPLPRVPTAILKAGHSGRCAALETAFSLFVSNTLRQFRASAGEPTVIVSAHSNETGGAELRVSVSSVLDDTLLEGFRWPLHALDDFGWTTRSILNLLRECRVVGVHAIPRVLSGLPWDGARLFLAVRDLKGLGVH